MTENNPYAAPAAELETDIEPGPREFTLTRPRSLSVGRGWGWIAGGFNYFKRSPGMWILTFMALVPLGFLVGLMGLAGHILLTATSFVWAGGIHLGCKAQAEGGAFHVKYLFAGFKKPANLIALSVLVGATSTLLMYLALGPLYFEMLSGNPEPSPELVDAVGDPMKVWVPMLVAMLFYIPVAMAAIFAPPLMIINSVPLGRAMMLSFVGCLKNLLPFLLYGVLAFVLYILAFIPLGLGLLVLVPSLAASIFVAYDEIFLEGGQP